MAKTMIPQNPKVTLLNKKKINLFLKLKFNEITIEGGLGTGDGKI